MLPPRGIHVQHKIKQALTAKIINAFFQRYEVRKRKRERKREKEREREREREREGSCH